MGEPTEAEVERVAALMHASFNAWATANPPGDPDQALGQESRMRDWADIPEKRLKQGYRAVARVVIADLKR